MSFFYLSHGLVIRPQHHIIEQGGKIVRVRPKTFALLLALLEQPQKILPKSQLLETIWDDVAVDEQVLVQSIREIRQLFGSPDVIKTYPRKGYCWVAEVQKQSVETATVEMTNAEREPTVIKSKPRYLIALTVLLAVVLVGTLVGGALVDGSLYAIGRSAPVSLDGPVMVLPVKTRLPGNDHQWVYLGAMDELIDLLASDEGTVVMDTVYVLNAMRHANMPRNYTSDHVARIFDVSGGALVVESELSGSVEDYRLDYKLHFKNDIKRGAVFGQTVDAVLAELGRTIANYTGRNLPNAQVDHQSEFNSELMSRALEYMDQGALETAQGLLVSLGQLEEHNLVARRLLAQVLIQRNAPALAEKELTAAINLGETANAKESARLHYWLAIAQSDQALTEKALATLHQADLLASDHGDWLYRAYIAELRGQLLDQLGHIEEAEAAFRDSLKHHGIIRCPIGEAQIQLQLASLLTAQGRQSAAEDYYSRAKSLIETHQLEALKPLLGNL